MTAWHHWTSTIADRLSKQLGVLVDAKEIVVPPDVKLGDFAFGVFRLAKERKKNPAEAAKEIAEAFDKSGTEIASVSAAGPYVNFTLAAGETVGRVVGDIEKQKKTYGENKDGVGKTVLFEYAQPNTHKELHIGHLRNLVLGASLVKLLRLSGWSSVPMSYHGDVGAHVAKCLWYLVKQTVDPRALTDEAAERILSSIPTEQRTGKFLGETYAAASAASEADESTKADISFVQQKLESGDPVWNKVWMETRKWSLDEMEEIFDELGVHIERRYLESEVVERGQKIVDDLLAKGVAKESQGAIIVDLEEVKLGVFLVRKSDRTSLYATKDLALAELKFKEYPEADRSVMLVDNRQAFYFKQLFETLRRMGFKKPLEFVGYEFVTLKDGAMSSRKGNVVTYQAFHDEVFAYVRKEVVERHGDWPKEKIDETAHAIALAGMKFGMLKQDNDKIYTFDLEQALSFDGATGPYVQYAATRLGSILRKAGLSAVAAIHELPLPVVCDHPTEKSLAMVLAAFPQKIRDAAAELRPSIIAQWCLDAAQAVNAFYRDVPVLDAEEPVRSARLRLAAAARQALAQGLELLGIPTPEEM